MKATVTTMACDNTKKITVSGKYLEVPVNRYASLKKILFRDADGLVFDFDAHIDTYAPKMTMYIDVERFRGREITVQTEPETDFVALFSETVPNDCDSLRPDIHFTAKRGWINDPNGLVFANGIYHLFCQHNPLGTEWGNMHWCHAVSDDMLHWNEIGDALFPDADGMIFSGSAVADTENISGLRDGKYDPILLYYTSAGSTSYISAGKEFTQSMAYSTDNGKTFKRYGTVIPHIVASNRDPKIVRVGNSFILALYLNGNDYAFFSTTDLKNFKEIGRITLEGTTECPDISRLRVENGNGKFMWVVSGAADIYAVGEMDENGFTSVQQSLTLRHGLGASYAAQSFFGVSDPAVRLAWDVMAAPEACFTNQLGIPCALSLIETDGLFRLRARPIPQLASLSEETVRSHITVSDGKPYKLETGNRACDVTVRPSADITINLYGAEFKTDIGENKLFCPGCNIPLRVSNKPTEIRIIADRIGYELFLDGGLIYSAVEKICDRSLGYLEISAAGDAEAYIEANFFGRRAAAPAKNCEKA